MLPNDLASGLVLQRISFPCTVAAGYSTHPLVLLQQEGLTPPVSRQCDRFSLPPHFAPPCLGPCSTASQPQGGRLRPVLCRHWCSLNISGTLLANSSPWHCGSVHTGQPQLGPLGTHTLRILSWPMLRHQNARKLCRKLALQQHQRRPQLGILLPNRLPIPLEPRTRSLLRTFGPTDQAPLQLAHQPRGELRPLDLTAALGLRPTPLDQPKRRHRTRSAEPAPNLLLHQPNAPCQSTSKLPLQLVPTLLFHQLLILCPTRAQTETSGQRRAGTRDPRILPFLPYVATERPGHQKCGHWLRDETRDHHVPQHPAHGLPRSDPATWSSPWRWSLPWQGFPCLSYPSRQEKSPWSRPHPSGW